MVGLVIGGTCLVHDSSLLLQRHSDWVFVAVSMQSCTVEDTNQHSLSTIRLDYIPRVRTDLMARISDHAAFFGERLERMAGNEPSSLDVVALEHLQQTADTNSSREET
jgi:hypothetical protein